MSSAGRRSGKYRDANHDEAYWGRDLDLWNVYANQFAGEQITPQTR